MGINSVTVAGRTVEIRPKPSVRMVMGFVPMVASVFVSVVLDHTRTNRKPNALRYGVFKLGVKARRKPWMIHV